MSKSEQIQEEDAGLSDEKNKAKAPHQGNGDSAEEEVGGPAGREPTRYGDWEIGGKCVDF